MKTDRTRALRDLILLVVISLLILITSFWLDPFARTISWIYRHDNWNLDVLSTLAIVLAVSLAIYSWRRWRELVAEVRAREKAQPVFSQNREAKRG